MGLTSSIIETGVDKLVNLINKKGRIASEDAAKELGVSIAVVMEWADFLEEEGIIKIEYKFTKPFLVARKLAKKDIREKAKEFSGKKEVFVRKAEVSLSFLDRESSKLESLKQEFDKIKKELGLDIGSIRDELEELKKYEQLKMSLDKRIEEQKTSAMEKLRGIAKQISVERKKYQDLLESIEEEEEELKKDREVADSIEKSEKMINDRLNSLKEFIKKVESKVETEKESVKVSGSNIQKLILMAENAKARVEKEKGLIDPLVEKSKNQAEKIKELQNKIVGKIMAKEKKLKGVKKASTEMKKLFKRKFGVLDVIEKVNKDRNDLQNELIDLIKKAKSFQLSSKSADIGKEMADIEKKFNEVDAKKKVFEKELKNLSSSFKS
jgi:chromosome segregation ATPase